MGPSIGLTRKELSRFGLADLVLAMSGPTSFGQRDRAGAAIEHFRNVSNAVDLLCGKEVFLHGAANPYCFSIPGDYLQQRTLTSATGSSGGYLIDGDIDHYVANLRNRGVLNKLPVNRLDGLAANVTLPRGTSNVTATTQGAETTTVNASDLALGQLSLTPHPVVAIVELSTLLLKGLGPAANAYVLREIDGAINQKLDTLFLNGAGNPTEPLGVLGTAGIGSQSGTSLAWAAGILEMVRLAELYGEGGDLAWVVAPDAAKILRGREKSAGSGFIMDDGAIGDFPSFVSNSAPAGSLCIAPWSSVSVATFGALSLEITPFASSTAFAKGVTSIRVIVDADWVVEQPAAVVKATSIT